MQTATQLKLLNFRKMRQDFSSHILRDGKELFDKGALKHAQIMELSDQSVKIHTHVVGAYAHSYECDIEIDRLDSEIVDSNCDCPYQFDCQHLACLLCYLEENLDSLLLTYLNAPGKEPTQKKEQFGEIFKQAESNEQVRKEKRFGKQILEEYVQAAEVLSHSLFFVPEEEASFDQAELAFLISTPTQSLSAVKQLDVQLAVRVAHRSKPIMVNNLKQFCDAVKHHDPLVLGGRRYLFHAESFGSLAGQILKIFIDQALFQDIKTDKGFRTAALDKDILGEILHVVYSFLEMASGNSQVIGSLNNSLHSLGLFWDSFEKPIQFSSEKVWLAFELQYIKEPISRILLSPSVELETRLGVRIEEFLILASMMPGVFIEGCYHPFVQVIKRQHLLELDSIRKMAIPQPLFGTFVENALPELMRVVKLVNPETLDQFVTLPFTNPLRGVCDLFYLDGEMTASLKFIYGEIEVPESASKLTTEILSPFVTKQGILARNLAEESSIVRGLFADFIKNEKEGGYCTNSEKKIVEFMTEVVPRFQDRVLFNCPENLKNLFIYDSTAITIRLQEGSRVDRIEMDFKVEGSLLGKSVDALWDCISSRRSFLVIKRKGKGKSKDSATEHSEETFIHPSQQILVLQLDKLELILQILDELHIKKFESIQIEIPLWNLANLNPEKLLGIGIDLEMTPRLHQVQAQMLNPTSLEKIVMPQEIQATLRSYQVDGMRWLYTLRQMGLNGILADDMGLGKTLQAIIALTQAHKEVRQKIEKGLQEAMKSISLIVCPTSLVDNWKAECERFHPSLSVALVLGTPPERHKILDNMKKWDVLITSYSLVQKDIEWYRKNAFIYVILDEAQHIKNRETRNARSVKQIEAQHKLILTGTPIENSLEDLWSLFDFLMPGLLGSFERFSDKYIRIPNQLLQSHLDVLRKKVSPFILRRMKKDVLKDLPPIAHIVYHCHLSPHQEEMYKSYALFARNELMRLVEKEGFEKVKIHVLATLTRLKQICCHPAIFAKDVVESGDSAKYEMFLELLGELIESGHKTVVFSQYTRMLSIIKGDLEKMGTRFCYLDGSSKNRLSIVKQFNEDPEVTVFLVSLKAGGTGLNLVGADSVIHYDMWWNPAVENQATDRVWRMGQDKKVSSYKLITIGTIEEKILQLQEEKKGLPDGIIRSDDDIVSKLSCDEVLDLLKI